MAAEYGIITGVLVKPTGTGITVPCTGGNITIGSTVIPMHCIGQMNPFSQVTGPISATGRIDFVYQLDTLPSLAIPDGTSKVLNTFDVTIGTYKISTCKMTNLTINASMDDVVKGSFSFVGLVYSTTTNPSLPTAVPGYKSWTLVASNLGTFQAVSIDLTIDNGVKPIHYMGASSPARNPQYLAEGYQSIKFNAKLAVLPTLPADITANALAAIAAPTFVFTDNASSPNTLTITFTNALAGELSQDLDPEDLVRYGVNYEAEAVTFT